MRIILFFFFLSNGFSLLAQVGIGTINPSPAAMLEVSSSSNGYDYRGFMPPRVTLEERDLMSPQQNDIGLLVFVNDQDNAEYCLQIWNGSSWQDVYCLQNIGFSNVAQNFDAADSWAYTSDVAFFDNGADGFYGITDNSRFKDITTLTNNFLGINDLDDEDENGTDDFATITFETVDISSAPNGVTVSFDYEFFEFDNNDDSFYTIVIDGIDQEEVQLIEGESQKSGAGSVEVDIPAGSSSVALRVRIQQNGADDYGGFDNFIISAN
ncbi:MAG: hypothetical protein V7767_03560 [Leeuwenhoekiella sp.]